MFGRMVAGVGVDLGGLLGYQMLLQNGRLLLRLDALEEQVALLNGSPVDGDRYSGGLTAGSVVLDFALPTLDGDTMTLSQWRGRRLLLIFFDPRCGFCRRMLPALAELEPDPADDRPMPIVVSTGDPAENRRVMQEHGVRCAVLLQERDEVAELYQVDATPMGYLIDEQGATASARMVGARTLLALCGPTPATPAHEEGESAHPRAGSLASSRINRTGLTAGTPAPPFHLPRVTGGELDLGEFLGRAVLLIFSDPLCKPCEALAPKLERIHRRSPSLQVLMVSRGDPEINRRKIAEQGLTFPVVLQRRWEISRAYGMFATPIGYLIDEHGVIAADVAVGADAILALVSGSAFSETGRKDGPIRGKLTSPSHPRSSTVSST